MLAIPVVGKHTAERRLHHTHKDDILMDIGRIVGSGGSSCHGKVQQQKIVHALAIPAVGKHAEAM